MILTHTSAPASPYDRGTEFGRRHAHAIAGTAAFYQRLFSHALGLTDEGIDEIGAQIGRRLASDAPDLLSEIAGMARAASVPLERLVAVNARTEVLAGARPPECSVVGVDGTVSAAGTPVLAQNWDWHPDVAQHLVLWTIHDDHGSMTTLTEAGILAKIGRNDHGIAVCLNIMNSSADGGAEGMPIHLLLRLLLQRCASWADAEEMLRRYPVAASSAISVASANDGRIGTFEMSPAGTVLVEPHDGVLLHTNHFLQLPTGCIDRYRRDWPDTVTRLDDLRSTLSGGHPTVHDITSALASHRAGRFAVCCHDDEDVAYADRQATLASVVIDLSAPGFQVARGNPCGHHYFDVTPDAASRFA